MTSPPTLATARAALTTRRSPVLPARLPVAGCLSPVSLFSGRGLQLTSVGCQHRCQPTHGIRWLAWPRSGQPIAGCSGMRLVVIATLVAGCAQNAPTGPVVNSHVDTFEIPGSPPPKLDVLFVLDDSPESASFAGRTDELLRGLETAWPTNGFPPPDLHVAVT